MIAALGASFITLRRPSTKIVMQPSFVVELGSLLLLGAGAATLLAVAALIMERLAKPHQSTTVTLVRIAGSYKLTDWLQAFGRIENALNAQYEEVFSFGTPGRAAYAGVRATF